MWPKLLLLFLLKDICSGSIIHEEDAEEYYNGDSLKVEDTYRQEGTQTASNVNGLHNKGGFKQDRKKRDDTNTTQGGSPWDFINPDAFNQLGTSFSPNITSNFSTMVPQFGFLGGIMNRTKREEGGDSTTQGPPWEFINQLGTSLPTNWPPNLPSSLPSSFPQLNFLEGTMNRAKREDGGNSTTQGPPWEFINQLGTNLPPGFPTSWPANLPSSFPTNFPSIG